MYFIRVSTKNTEYTVKKSVDFTVKYLESGCQFFYRYFYGRLSVEHFWKSRYGWVMLTHSTRKYLCRIVGLYDKNKKKKKKRKKNNNVLCYCSVPDS